MTELFDGFGDASLRAVMVFAAYLAGALTVKLVRRWLDRRGQRHP